MFEQRLHRTRITMVTYLFRQMIKADVEGSETLALAVDLSRDEGDAVSEVLGVEAVLGGRSSLFAAMPPCGFFLLVIGRTRSTRATWRTFFLRRWSLRRFGSQSGLSTGLRSCQDGSERP